MSIDALYGAATVIERLQHNGVWHSNVELEWVYLDRAQPIAPYAALIAGYRQLGQPQRAYAEQYMDELFTTAECQLLRSYLEDHHQFDVTISVVPIPIEVQPASVGFMATPARRMLAVDESGRFGWYRLPTVAETLPFNVAAWYLVGSSAGADTTP